jgi:hypothetical protein
MNHKGTGSHSSNFGFRTIFGYFFVRKVTITAKYAPPFESWGFFGSRL